MMVDATALKVAIDLLHVPSRVRPMRSAALPDGVLALLQIAAGDEETTSRATELTGRTQVVVRDAATFFIEQILLAPESDSYRVLGASPQASSGDLRRNMALLLRWLHPDMERNGSGNADRSVFAGRVTLAWDDLKTAERRAAYDAARLGRTTKTSLRRGKSAAQRKPSKRPAGKHLHGGALVGKRGGPGGGPLPGRLWKVLRSLFGGARH